jgi:hypothetical protein
VGGLGGIQTSLYPAVGHPPKEKAPLQRAFSYVRHSDQNPNAEYSIAEESSFWRRKNRRILRIKAAILVVLSENSIRPGIRIVRQNQRMIGADACNPALARNVHCRLVQVASSA